MDSISNRNHVYSRVIKNDNRTYFLDVRLTKRGQQYITITESKKKFDQSNGKMYYEKHKVFLYDEDFEDFQEALRDVASFAAENNKKYFSKKPKNKILPGEESASLGLNFEDLGKE
ncbi:MAG: PUR family DNA/RNA-binding protein [Chlorobi bacterium]|nr:PUR family DNA/RNA-binding protein [Chlorobiota bacterium]